MKTVKFLTSLAMASMLVACVEDLAPVENIQQEMDKVVGGEVIGTDVTMDIPVVGVQTKFAGGQDGFDTKDKLGLGWIVKTDVATTQDKNVDPDVDKLFANHLFTVNANGQFESRGNIYKGWHFSYFPYNYMDAVGEMELDLNPAQTLNILTEDGNYDTENYSMRRAQKFAVSSLHFLTSKSLIVEEGYKLDPTIDFAPYSPLNEIIIKTEPAADSEFATAETLKNYTIQSMTIKTATVNRFATTATLKPTALHQYDNTLTTESDSTLAQMNATRLMKSFKNAIVGEKSSSITIDLSGAGYKVGNLAAGLAYTLPHYEAKGLSKNYKLKTVVTISTNNGDFVITYTQPQDGVELTDWQAHNNATIDKLAKELGENGQLTTCGNMLVLNFKLHEDLFQSNYWTVKNDADWAAKCTLATELGVTNPTFTLDENANITFTNDTTVPAGGVKVEGTGTITVTEAINWNNSIVLGENVTLVNKSVINTAANTVLNNLDNTEGEVKVVWGAQVYPVEEAKAGKISYTLEAADVTDPKKINKLTETGLDPDMIDKVFYANVNTLVVGEGIVFDLAYEHTYGAVGSDNDPYQPSNPDAGDTVEFENIETINFVINGGSIKSSDAVQTVNKVTMNVGNVGPNINMSALTIEGGDNIVDAKAINGNVLVKAGAGTITATNIIGTFTIEKGNYTVSAESITGNVVAVGENSFLGVKEFGANLSLTQTQNGSTLNGNIVTGDVTLTGEGGIFDVHNVSAKDMTISGAVKLVKNCMISGNLTNDAENTVAVTGTKITGNFTNKGKANLQDTTVEGLLTNNSEVTISGETTVGSIVNNGELTSSIDLHVIDVTLNEGSTTTLSSNGTKWDRTIWYTGKYVFNQMTLQGTVAQFNAAQLNADIDAAIAAAANGTPQTVELKGDVTLTQPLTFTAPVTRAAAGKVNVTINLNGYNITNSTAVPSRNEGMTMNPVFYIENPNLVLTIEGDGTVESTSVSDFTIPVWVREGEVYIKGGKYISRADVNGGASHAVYAMNTSNVYISGGVFEAYGNASGMENANPLNCQDHTEAIFHLSGGKYLNFGADKAAQTGTNGKEIEVEAGYEWTESADAFGYYSVVPVTTK